MPSREEMILALKAQDELAGPSREDMIRALKEQDSGSGELPEPKRHSKADAAIMAGLQGASAGFLDEISGLGEAAGRAVGVKGMGGKFRDVGIADEGPTLDWETLRDAYRQARDKKRSLLKDQAAEYPAETLTAGIAGAIVSPANKLAKGVSLAKGGAAVGGVTAAGMSEADNAKDLLVDTAIGTGTGLVLGKGVDKVAKGADKAVSRVGAKSRELANRFAARALGAERATVKKFGQEGVEAAGRQALDEGVLTAFGNTDKKIAANEAVKSLAMNARKAAYDKIDEAGASTFSPLEVASKVEQKILAGKNRAHQDVQETMAALEPHLQNILSRGEGTIPMSEAQKLVEALSQKAKFDSSRSTQANQVAKQVYHTVREAINDAAAKSADKVGASGLKQTIEQANKTYSKGMTASTLLKNKEAREQGNRIMSLTDIIMGGSALGYGGATGDWQNAVTVMAGKKYLEKYGAQQAALTLNKLSKTLASSPALAEVAKKSPPLFVSIAQKIERKGLPAAAENEELTPELKGKDKWVSDGFSKVQKHSPDLALDPESIGKMISSPPGRSLLIQASDLKPGTKAFDSLMVKIKAHAKGSKS